MKYYFCRDYIPSDFHAGNKARMDVDDVFKHKQWTCINNLVSSKKIKEKTMYYYVGKVIVLFRLIIGLRKINSSIIFIQYPMNRSAILSYIITKIMSYNNKICAIVHDIDSLRYDEKLEKEIKVLNNFNMLILHNKVMKQALEGCGLKKNISVSIEIFDYLLKEEEDLKRENKKDVVFAGNLGGERCKFLSKIFSIDFCLYLYGPGYSGQIKSGNAIYKGSFSPEDIADKLVGSFGLLWDGESLETCTGLMGQYTRYNNPHKLSLYMAAGLPVIVWEDAAVSGFVLENNIGFTIKNIYEIGKKIDAIDDLQYQQYIKNISRIRKQVRSGYYTNHALDKVIEILESEKI